ncbi:MAG: hypothetical protein V7754_19815 [Halioglobus sp.]
MIVLEHVCVGVDQSGHYELAAKVDNFRGFIGHCLDVCGLSHGDELAIFDRNGFSPNIAVIDSIDFAVGVNRVNRFT